MPMKRKKQDQYSDDRYSCTFPDVPLIQQQSKRILADTNNIPIRRKIIYVALRVVETLSQSMDSITGGLCLDTNRCIIQNRIKVNSSSVRW